MALVLKTPSRLFWRYYNLPRFVFSRVLLPRQEELTIPWDPEIDIEDSDGAYSLRVTVEDAKPDDLEVTVDEGVITIKGERHQERRVERGDFDWREISRSSFTRTLPLPGNTKWKETEATFEDGVLQVTIPMAVAEIPVAVASTEEIPVAAVSTEEIPLLKTAMKE